VQSSCRKKVQERERLREQAKIQKQLVRSSGAEPGAERRRRIRDKRTNAGTNRTI